MLKIMDLEEKKLIMIYAIARQKNYQNEKENVFDKWSAIWPNDFRFNGRQLKRYNHEFVPSKNKAKEMERSGITPDWDFKEYDIALTDICEWLKENYNTTKPRRENIACAYDMLFGYRAECDKIIRDFLDESGLKEKGYWLQYKTRLQGGIHIN